MKIILLLTYAFIASNAFAEWNIITPSKDTPKPLEGSIFGRNFTFGRASWSNHALTIESKNKMGGWAESELIIFLKKENDKKQWLITPEKSDFSDPHVHRKFGKKGAQFQGALMFTGEYCMYLKLIKKTDTEAMFQIHISMPDYKKSYLMGSFTATIK